MRFLTNSKSVYGRRSTMTGYSRTATHGFVS